MWNHTYDQRELVQIFERANTDEEILFELAFALGQERRLAYSLLTSAKPDQSDLNRLRQRSRETDLLLKENEAAFVSMDTAALGGASAGHGHQHSRYAKPMHHDMVTEPTKDQISEHPHNTEIESESHSVSAMSASEQNSVSHQSYLTTLEEGSAISQIIAKLRHQDHEMYRQLTLDKSSRLSMYSMIRFHEFTTAIDSIDSVRQSLHTAIGQRLSEHYIITKLKDSFWDFRESISQISALLEGVATLFENSETIVQSHHYADMLVELNVRVDIAWGELVKAIESSSNSEILQRSDVIDAWYNKNFRVKSIELAGSTQFTTVSLIALRDWLSSAQELTSLTEGFRKSVIDITEGLIRDVEHRTTINLLQVSILVLTSLLMALASALFFRQVDKQAHQDELTGLDNRRMFSIRLEKYCAKADTETGILMVDLDRFKHINDTMGHAAGDKLLKEVSQRITTVGSECNSISRLGGDEFAMLFQGDGTNTMQKVAEQVRQSIKEPFDFDGATLNIGSSIGIASCPQHATSPDSLLQAADLAMYCAKKSGTNQIKIYDSEIDQSMTLAARTVTDLQIALNNNEFELYYQPQFNLAQAQVLSAEALIRWNHPERGLLTPNHFIPIAEESGLMPAIGNWVIEEACRQAADWLYRLKMPLRVAINISADHFFQPDFVKNVVDSLERHKLPPYLLEVEVTESVAMNDIKLVVESLKQLRDLSVHIALDDFGTGYSSLSYLQELPLDTLKIDKSFIQNMLQGNTQKESITETIVHLGKTLNLETVAEGVETIDQLNAVSEMRITVVQGYYYSRPVPAQEIEYVVLQLNNTDQGQKAA